MTWLTRLFRRGKLERELAAELEFHLQQQTRDLIAAGFSPDQAAREARLAFGGTALIQEECRDARGSRWLEDWWHDTRFALRTMWRAPAFTIAAVATLGIGIGANTAVFSLIDALLLRPLPVERPGDLTILHRVGIDDDHLRFSQPGFRRLQEVMPPSTSLATMSASSRMWALIGDSPEAVLGQLVSGEWFPLLGVEPALGRLLGGADEATGTEAPVAVLSHAFWTRRFGRSGDVLGRIIRLNGTPVTVVGVAAPGFFGMEVGTPIDLWLPLAAQAPVKYRGNAGFSNSDTERPWRDQPGITWLTAVAHIPDGVDRSAVRSRLNTVFRQTEDVRNADRDEATRRMLSRERVELLPAARGLSDLREEFDQPLVVLMATVTLVLLITCANLANLLLARSAARSHEVAVRLSLGARGGRLMRQTLTESVTLALFGGLASLAVAQWGSVALLRAAANGPGTLPLILRLDLRLLGFALAVSLVTGVVFGLAPALRAVRTNLHEMFKTGGRATGGGNRRITIPRVLVVSQVGLSLVLVVVAGLFVRTLQNLVAIDPGYERSQLLAARIDSRAGGYTPDQLPAFYQRLMDGVSQLPAVRSVNLSLYSLAGGHVRISGLTVPGRPQPAEWDNSAQENFVTGEFIRTTGMQLLQGRNFAPSDRADGPKVAIVTRSMARHFFGTVAPVGLRFETGGIQYEVVGVLEDARLNHLRGDPPRAVWYSLAQHPGEYVSSVEARVEGDPAQAAVAIRRALMAVDPLLPVREVVTIDELLGRQLRSDRLVSKLTGAFGALAALLASIGLYGVMSYSVARRTRELGVRLALGASPGAVRWLVLRDTLGLVGVGLALGVAILVPSVGVVRNLVYGLSPRDPATLLLAALALLAVGTGAGALPAWRASRIDPAGSLRAE